MFLDKILDKTAIKELTFIENSKAGDFTKRLLKMAQEHPDYPIVVLAGEEASDGDHSYTYCENVGVDIDKILGCVTPWWTYDTVCTDPEDFEDEVWSMVWDKLADQLGRKPTNEEAEEAVLEIVKAHEPYWINVISISANN